LIAVIEAVKTFDVVSFVVVVGDLLYVCDDLLVELSHFCHLGGMWSVF
jgi:hypothetical protein